MGSPAPLGGGGGSLVVPVGSGAVGRIYAGHPIVPVADLLGVGGLQATPIRAPPGARPCTCQI
jgi:hypothetical protein